MTDKDLFQEMRLVLKLHRVPGIDLEPPPKSYQVLEMATANGAYASWFGDRIGTLEPGKRARPGVGGSAEHGRAVSGSPGFGGGRPGASGPGH